MIDFAYLKKKRGSVPYYLIWWLALILTDQDNAPDDTKITTVVQKRFFATKKETRGIIALFSKK